MEQNRQARKVILSGRVVQVIEAAPDGVEYSRHQTYQETGQEKEKAFSYITGQR
jgi:hypothetical protein